MPRPTLTVLALLLLLSASINAADPPIPLADRRELSLTGISLTQPKV